MPIQFLSNFTPSLMPGDALEAIFVQRQKLAHRIIDLIRESASTGTKHHTLLVGPRGIGKTHFVALIYHRLNSDPKIADKLRIAWLREEEWGVTSFLDLSMRILRALAAEYPNEVSTEKIEAIYRNPHTAEKAANQLVLQSLNGKTLLLIVENLDDLFIGLGDSGQKKFRAFLQENPVCTILATSQSLFSGVSKRVCPFYGFFRIQHLEALELRDVINLLVKVARAKGDDELESFIRSPKGRARVRAVHHLAGGNHRVYMIFSQFLNRASLDDLVQPFMRMLDELTPYYQARMMWLSQQQRKIIEFLCDRRGAVPVKEIAQKGFMTQQTASSQLKDLREKGYVVASTVGRDAYYELREPLMRLCIEVKKHRGEPIRLFVDFLRLWYSPEELKNRLASLSPEFQIERQYLLRTLQEIQKDPRDPRMAVCLREFQVLIRKSQFAEALEVARELVAIAEDSFTLGTLAMGLAMVDRHEEALEVGERAVQLATQPPYAARFAQTFSLVALGRRSEALDALSALPVPSDAIAKRKFLLLRSMILASLDNEQQALDALQTAIELGEDNAEAFEREGDLLVQLGRHEEAVVAYDRAEEKGGKTWQLMLSRAVALVQIDRWAEALAASNKAIELTSESPLAWQLKALTLYVLGRTQEALGAAADALARDPHDAYMHEIKGDLLMMTDAYSEAQVAFERALELDPESVEASLGRAEAVLATDWSAGIALLQSGLKATNQESKFTSDVIQRILKRLLRSDTAQWPSQTADLLDVFRKTDRVPLLNDALVRVLSVVPTHPSADDWVNLWRSIGASIPALALSIRLLDAALRYHRTRDKRIALELPQEERKILLEACLLEPESNSEPGSAPEQAAEPVTTQ